MDPQEVSTQIIQVSGQSTRTQFFYWWCRSLIRLSDVGDEFPALRAIYHFFGNSLFVATVSGNLT
jgi:hypothetical protein